MNMCAIRDAAFARRMSDMFSLIHVSIGLDAVTRFDVHIKNIPASLFVTVVIQIFDDLTLPGAYDPAIRRRDHPGVATDTTSRFAGWSEIESCPSRPLIPATM